MPLWTPDVWGSGSKPAGTRSTQEGAYWFTEIIGDPMDRSRLRLVRLEPVTQRENLLRGETITARNAAKTHCPRGHAYTAENTYVRPRGSRECRTCNRLRQAK